MDSLLAAIAWLHPFPPGTSSEGCMLGNNVRFSPACGKWEIGKKVSRFALPAMPICAKDSFGKIAREKNAADWNFILDSMFRTDVSSCNSSEGAALVVSCH